MYPMPTVALATIGCKLNFAETSALGKQFVERGYTPVEFGFPADVTVINTCSVTARADRECRQLIRRTLRASPDSVVVVTGCYAQLKPEEVASIRGVDFVMGTREKSSIATAIGVPAKQAVPRVRVSDISDADDFGPAWSSEVGGRTRAFLKVQDGCDYSCSFCTIPLARGPSRSQATGEAILQAESLVAGGYREIVLTGVNVGDYGRKSGTNLLALLRALAGVRGLDRLRVSSIEPNLLTDEIIEFAASSSVMCRHFHVPLQSGSDAVLGMMRRRYTARAYGERVRALARRIPDCGIGVDVIVGFPGETDELFRETCEFVGDLPISYLHVFTYSERPDTPASVSAPPVPPSVRAERSRILRGISLAKKQAFYARMVGKTLPVLLEADGEDGCRCGFTGNYVRVRVPSGDAPENSLVDVAITGLLHDRCTGRVLRPGRNA
jgi:threonylcarbamoyladenosine tRNA methylthiotransferase MtaB